MNILAHRGYFDGPDPNSENRPESMARCLERGWGLETDIRQAPDGRFYISHDPVPITEENEAEAYCRLWRRYPYATIALNVKELGCETSLLTFLENAGVLNQLFLFDMELLETSAGSTARRLRQINPSVRLAARVSDRNESIDQALTIEEAEVIWIDEFDHLWIGESEFQELKAAGRQLYAISPEIHGFSHKQMRRRWHDFATWGIDGICTDHPVALDAYLRELDAMERSPL